MGPSIQQVGMVTVAPAVEGQRGTARVVFGRVGILFLSVVAFVIGVALLAVLIVAVVLFGLVWLLTWARARLATIWHRMTGRQYPVVFPTPRTAAERRLVLGDVFASRLAGRLGIATRVAVALLTPLVLVAALCGIGFRGLRARPYIALRYGTLLTKLIGIGRNFGYLVDGDYEVVDTWDDWIAEAFPELSKFAAWWNSGTTEAYESNPPLEESDVDDIAAAGITVRGHPDPTGYPGLAGAVIRRRTVATLRDAFLSQREIDDLCDPNLDDRPDAAIVRVVNCTDDAGGRRWIVQVSSTQSWHARAGAAPNDLTADLLGVGGSSSVLLRATIAAMKRAGIAQSEPVMMCGFSLGGVIGAQVAAVGAAHGFTVTHLLTGGAPIARIDVPSSVAVMSIEHVLDPVPRLDALSNPVRDPEQGGWVTVTYGPPMPPDYTVVNTHHAPSYAETCGVVRDLDDPRVQAFLSSTSAFFDASQHLADFAVRREYVAAPQAAVPVYFSASSPDGLTRRALRAFLRRIDGVVAVDVYQSRSGFPFTKVWSVDLLVDKLDRWIDPARRRFLYERMLALVENRSSVGLGIRIMGRGDNGEFVTVTLLRGGDGWWTDELDPTPGMRPLDLRPVVDGADELTVAAEHDSQRVTYRYEPATFHRQAGRESAAT